MHRSTLASNGMIISSSSKDSSIDGAKRVLINTLYQGSLRERGNGYIGVCPFHEDSKPSFYVYKDTNTWCCFAGCGAGDVISFYIRLYGTDFKTAVEELNKL